MISIITTCYNIENYINDCIKSLLSQTYKDIEIIIINDCSTDATMDIIKSFNDNRIKIINNDKNIGCGASRKKGLSMVNGDYVAFVDGDDYISENYIEDLYNIAIKEDADIVLAHLDSNGKYKSKDLKFSYLTDKDKVDFYRNEYLTFLNNKLIKKTLWDKVSYCDRRFIEDFPTYAKLLYHAKKIISNHENKTCYYFYRQHDKSLVNSSKSEKAALFTALAWLDIWEFLSTVKKNAIHDLYNKYSLRNNVMVLFNPYHPLKLNMDLIKQEFPNEYHELVTRWERIKYTL